ncbi:hypothetical protein Tco_0240555 [Tanacetum coccineum]
MCNCGAPPGRRNSVGSSEDADSQGLNLRTEGRRDTAAEDTVGQDAQLRQRHRANSADYRGKLSLGCEYLEGVRTMPFCRAGGVFTRKWRSCLEKHDEKLRKTQVLSIYRALPSQCMSAITERKWLISHGLCLAAMSALESQEVKQSFGDVVKCALARGLVAAMNDKLIEAASYANKLERDQDYPISVIMAGLTLARHATEGAEAQPDYFLKPDVAQLQVPIFARPRDILNPFALEKEIPLKESLEAHAIRLAKKKGVKGKAILCGVGAAHIPRSDGVPVSVATVSPKDSELHGKHKGGWKKLGVPRRQFKSKVRCQQASRLSSLVQTYRFFVCCANCV